MSAQWAVAPENPDTPETPGASVSRRLREVAGALRAGTEAVVRPLGLSAAQYSCLELLSRCPGCSGAEIARATYVSRQSTHVLLGSMEGEGLVERSPAVGRSLAWSITARGERRLAEARHQVERVDAIVLGGLGPRQRAQLRHLLETCAEGLEGLPGSAVEPVE